VMLSMDKVNIGGGKFLARCAAAQLAAGVAAVLAFGFELQPESTMLNVVASLPLLVGYPMTIEFTSYRLSWQVREQNRRLAELTRTDGLSGLLNRKYWEEAVSGEFQRCRRIGYASTVLMLDLDGLKPINDRYGHQAGDQVIRRVAAALRDALRQQDIPGRYGGDEFGIVLPGTDSASGQVIAERVRERVASTVLEREADLRATVSIGVAGLEAKDANYSEWLEHADRALYQAKELGRNRTVCYGA
jgi:diguanylate cyclase